MTRCNRHRNSIRGRGVRTKATHQATVQTRLSINFGGVDRKALLLGTALVSTLLLGTVAAPTPAHAVLTCAADVGTGPTPINHSTNEPIICVNTEPRTNAAGDAIYLDTSGKGSYISLNNSGKLTAINSTGDAFGIYAHSDGNSSPITITNSGDITATSTGGDAAGIWAESEGDVSGPITINNSGDITATSTGGGKSGGDAYGIRAFTSPNSNNSRISINNSGDITATTTSPGYLAAGIWAEHEDDNSPITINNSGDITATSRGRAVGIYAESDDNSKIIINNSGDITATSTSSSGEGGNNAYGINAYVEHHDDSSSIIINNSGDITATANAGHAVGIGAENEGFYNSPITINNSGNITATSTSGRAEGIYAESHVNGPITINNSGDITATSTVGRAVGIYAYVEYSNNSRITINNSGDITATSTGGYAYGIYAVARNPGTPISINNSGSVFGGSAGIHTHAYGSGDVTIVNTGDISAGSQLAIYAYGSANTNIFNSGKITGFIRLDADDTFTNQAGGVFEARKTSDFDYTGPGGNDLFVNQAGGMVHTAGNANVAETTQFIHLETFKNRGLISTIDGGTGDRFTLSNTPGGKDLKFQGGGWLGVDAFLGGPGSKADNFIVQGNVSGTTTVAVNNTNFGPGAFNTQGIPVVFVTGKTPKESNFQLAQPIDTGFFDYDLYFTPTGSGFWDLRSYPGAGAHLLPQLVTAAQDIWHQTSSTWFDRTADLRVLLNGGGAPTAYDPGGKSLSDAPSGNFTPAVWARGSGGWLERDDTARTTAYGRDYSFDLDRDLETIDFQVGIDMGKRDFLSQGDALVFGLLGGFVHGNLDYDSLARQFDFDGGQVGAYATYLNGGLFVDTLLNVHLYSLDTATLGFPDSLDANTVGLRTDTGYRFGSFTGGAFLEPLATIEVTWADIDGFSLGGNTVSFDNDANVRGRLGLRAGTTTEAWEGTLMEPFVTGSLWGNLSDDNQATLVSNSTTFRFQDDIDDVWGEVSAGVNFFNFSQTTAVFAKVDVTFGDDVSGVGGKAGMRVAW